ncbi:MAG: UDP-N-acetylmuramate dehydrogenase [Simkaniaceae bacterium]|nr:UDP-N-acetylmuramate dehydrogenase [Simkaniaceae bacterium]
MSTPSSIPSSKKPHLNVALSRLTSFRIGGPARYLFEVTSTYEAKEAIAFAKERDLPYYVLGKGSNSIFDDSGYDGVIILNKIEFLFFDGPDVHVGGGYSFSLLGAQTARRRFSGLEFASGIPGSVGGAVYMNAGANGGETKDTLVSVDFLTDEGQLLHLKRDEIEFKYRYSSFQEMKGIILGARFCLRRDEKAKERQVEIVKYRTSTQPYHDPSAGCIFRNPEPEKAGRLIEECGLKGFQIGGAEVSVTHANFIVNRGNAKASDVLELIEHVKKVVKEKTGIDLEMEVRRVTDGF